MVYEASSPKIDDAIISIPGISHMLVIGDSATAHRFSAKIKNITQHQTIYNVPDIESATDLMKVNKFSIVVIDSDSDVDPISASRLARVQNANVRIVMISTHISVDTIFEMKNKGIIHGHISMPCDDIYAHTIVVQEQAKYHINQTLQQMIIDPPEDSTSYRVLKSGRMMGKLKPLKRFDLLALSIVHETVSQYNLKFDDNFDLEPLLLSSYFSAISKFSEKLLDPSRNLESFDFRAYSEQVVVYVNTIDELQYVFVLRNVVEENQSVVEDLVINISNKIHISFGDQIIQSKLLSKEQELEHLIKYHLPAHQKDTTFFDAEQKIKVINIHEPHQKLSEIYDETSRVYEVHYVDEETQLLDMLAYDNYDIVIINGFEKEFKRNKILLNIVKDESPFTQAIAIIDDITNVEISDILNVNDLDYIIQVQSEPTEYYELFKRAIERSKAIQEGLVISDLSRIYRIQDQPEIIKTMLRKNIEKFGSSTIPLYHGLFIMIDQEKFYSHYLVEDKNSIAENESLFTGFIGSLMTFTDELAHSPLVLSGIKYGGSNIIVQENFEYHFIYFIGNLDKTNYDLVYSVLEKKTREIYEIIKYDINPHVMSEGLGSLIDEVCMETNNQFKNLDY